MKLAAKKIDIPTKPHYAIILLESLSYSSGFAGSENDMIDYHNKYYYTDDKSEWLKEIEKIENGNTNHYGIKQNYFAIEVSKVAKVQLKISID